MRDSVHIRWIVKRPRPHIASGGGGRRLFILDKQDLNVVGKLEVVVIAVIMIRLSNLSRSTRCINTVYELLACILLNGCTIPVCTHIQISRHKNI